VRSVYAKILVWSLASLFISMGLFFFISRQLAMRLGMGDPFLRGQELELQQARHEYEAGGRPRLADFMARVNRVMRWHHYLLDSRGQELATGEDCSQLLALLRGTWNKPVRAPDGMMFASRTQDHRYALVVQAPVDFDPWVLLPYYGLILLTVAALCWPLAFHIAGPLRALSRTVDRFGQGDFSVRAELRRRDEVGDLSRSFDRMADRIETLLTAERRLLQDISHELRSPLARLTFATELIQTDPEPAKAMARIRKEVSRLSTLIGALIEMTRAEGDPTARRRKPFRLDELAQQIAEDYSETARIHPCEIRFVPGAEITISGDEELMRRAIENVVRNAIQYSPAGGTVYVEMEALDGFALVYVRDRGPGVPAEKLPKIFDPFFRVDDSRTGASAGIGLGLSIAMRAVSLHNGSIQAANADPGLLVTIRIPQAA
jgi:two-component system sensor histidine kinase CpxA